MRQFLEASNQARDDQSESSSQKHENTTEASTPRESVK